MSLKHWADSGWLKPHRSTRKEIGDLLLIVDRDLRDARSGISADWRFGIAYNAALKLATILLAASGYRAERSMHHLRTIKAIPLILGSNRQADASYLDTCRRKRNLVEYDAVGGATDEDADELIAFVESFRTDVLHWLQKVHPELLDG
jgi:hypothetical protein